jgi:hypothetical protein
MPGDAVIDILHREPPLGVVPGTRARDVAIRMGRQIGLLC